MYKRCIKRILDIIGALILMPFVLLVIIVLAPIIYFTDKGPVFYNAQRLGVKGRPFKMYKLRSMYVNVPDLRNNDGSTYNNDSDGRVTPIGRFMRKTSLDEFPQFINVLTGDMSFVGPRPTIGKIDYENCSEEIRKRYDVKPGVTGYAQAYYRNSISQEEKFKWDAYYSDNVSFVLDVKIVFMTFFSVVMRRNINSSK